MRRWRAPATATATERTMAEAAPKSVNTFVKAESATARFLRGRILHCQHRWAEARESFDRVGRSDLEFGVRALYWRAAAAYVEQSKPDAVILAPGYLYLTFNRYWSVPADTVPVLRVTRGAELNWPWRFSSSRRVALVLSHAGPAEERVREHLDATRQRVAEMNFPAQNGIRIYVYEPRVPPE